MSFVKITDTTAIFFSIFSKVDKDSISDKEIQDLISGYL